MKKLFSIAVVALAFLAQSYAQNAYYLFEEGAELTTSTKVLGMNQSGRQKTWYGKGYGSVKMETYNAKGKLVSGNILVGIKGM